MSGNEPDRQGYNDDALKVVASAVEARKQMAKVIKKSDWYF